MANEDMHPAKEADVEVVLAAIEFPTTKDELVDAAQGAEMDETVVVFFEALPDQPYRDRGEVDKAIEDNKGIRKDTSDQPPKAGDDA